MELSNALLESTITSMNSIINDVKQGKHFDTSILSSMASQFITELSSPSVKGPFSLVVCPDMKLFPIYHTLNVTILSVLMASRLGYKGEKLIDITTGALLHDIGKINTPDHLQWKQEGADQYESQMIAEHPTFGSHWIGRLVMLTETVRRIIVEHHERFDGKGYPGALADQLIAPESKLIAVCNTYAHLTTDLPEKPKIEPREAMFTILKQSGTKFAPKIAQSFITSMAPLLLDGPLYQPSALVLLDTKEVAAVMKVEHWGDTSPEIVILTDSSQKKLMRPLSISLKKDISRKIIKVIKTG